MKRISLRILFISGYLGILILAGYLSQVQILPFKIENLLDRDHPARKAYENYLTKYNDENEVSVLLESQTNLFEGERLYDLDQFANNAFKSIAYVERVRSISTAEYAGFEGRSLKLYSFFDHRKLKAKAEQLLVEEPLWNHSFINPDGKSLLLTIELSPHLENKDEEKFLIETKSALNQIEKAFPEVKSHMIGVKVAKFYFIQEMKRNQRVVMPLLLLVLGLLFLLSYRSWTVVFFCLASLILNQALMTLIVIGHEKGLGPYTGFSLLFLLIVGTAELIHIFARYWQLASIEDPNQRMRMAVRDVWKPCLYAAITTFIGFITLITNESLPVRDFGIYCALGTMLSFGVSFVFIPLAFRIFALNPKLTMPTINISVEWFIKILNKRAMAIVIIWTLIFAISGWASLKLHIDDNLYEKFVADHPLTEAAHAVRRHFHFLGSIDLILKFPESTYLKSDFEEGLKDLSLKIEALPEVSHVRSLATFQTYFRNLLSKAKYSRSENDEILKSIFNLFSDFDVLRNHLPVNENETRMSIFVKSLSSQSLETTMAQIQEIANAPQYKGLFTAEISGFAAIRSATFNSIVRNFVSSFSSSFILIFAMFLFLFRSWTWSIIGMIPNVFPLLAVGGLMAWFKVSMDNNLVILICIVIGIAVDDTTHFLYAIREEVREGVEYREAIMKAYRKCVRALIAMNMVFVMALPCFFLTKLNLFVQLGIFLSLSLTLGLLADLILLPAILLVLEDRFKIRMKA